VKTFTGQKKADSREHKSILLNYFQENRFLKNAVDLCEEVSFFFFWWGNHECWCSRCLNADKCTASLRRHFVSSRSKKNLLYHCLWRQTVLPVTAQMALIKLSLGALKRFTWSVCIFPRYVEGHLELFSAFQNVYSLISRFLAAPLTPIYADACRNRLAVAHWQSLHPKRDAMPQFSVVGAPEKSFHCSSFSEPVQAILVLLVYFVLFLVSNSRKCVKSVSACTALGKNSLE
jgi:hypothetical protein